MKTRFVFVLLSLSLNTVTAVAAMSKVVGIRDSRTVITETGGVLSTVVLRGVKVSAGEESAAASYLRTALLDMWVYVENGDVYRSPDGLFVNAAMQRRAWYGATYMGELAFPPVERRMAPPEPRTDPRAAKKAEKKPPKKAKGARQTRRKPR